MESNRIGSIVRYHRKRAGLSRKALATIAGVGKTVIYDIEHGKQTMQYLTLMRILEALNITLRLESPLMEAFEREAEAQKARREERNA